MSGVSISVIIVELVDGDLPLKYSARFNEFIPGHVALLGKPMFRNLGGLIFILIQLSPSRDTFREIISLLLEPYAEPECSVLMDTEAGQSPCGGR